MATLLYRLGLGSYRHRFVSVLVWVLVLIGCGVGAATLGGKTVSDFHIPGQESTTAISLISQRFPSDSGSSAQVVLQAPPGQQITSPANAKKVATLVTQLGHLPGVVRASNPLNPQAPTVSRDQQAAYSTVSYAAQGPDVTAAQRAALLSALAEARSGGLTVEVTGEATQPVSEVGIAGEIIGVVAALIVLGITYGSLVAAGMNLLTAIVGVGIGFLGVTILTGFVQLQSTTPVLAIMLGLAVGIDYALFIFSRFRQELIAGRPVPEAVGIAVGTAGSAVLTAGTTVVIALVGLSVAGIPFLTQMGLAAAATVVIAVLLAITLVPAVLGLIGARALPRRVRRELQHAGGRHNAHGVLTEHPFFRSWGHTLTHRRVLSLLVAVVTLGVIAIPVFSMQTSLSQPDAAGSTQAKASALLARHFGAGVGGPLVVLVDGPGALARAQAVSKEAAALDDVALATPAQPNPAGTAALVTVIARSAPHSPQTGDLVRSLRARLAKDPAGTAKTYVTGATAISVDVSQKLSDTLPVYLVLVVGLALVLLVLVFRSILVPLIGVVGFLLTIGVALGATTAVFQWGWLKDLVFADTTGPLLSLAPIIVVGILFGLAMDYQVFLVSRMHEAHAHGADALQAVTTGFRQAAPVVLAAAAIMFSVFAGFVPQGDATIKPIGFALAIGILADAVVVRMIAVPAALALLGRSAWWLPRWLQWLPVLDVDGAGLERTVPAPRAAQSLAEQSARTR